MAESTTVTEFEQNELGKINHTSERRGYCQSYALRENEIKETPKKIRNPLLTRVLI